MSIITHSQQHGMLATTHLLEIVRDPVMLVVNTLANTIMTTSNIKLTQALEPSEPLWKRAPTHHDGRPVSDFMMLIPRLKRGTELQIQDTIDSIQSVLQYYHKAVLFADLNIKLNLLWVSVKPIPGICLELPAAIQLCVPDAKLVGQNNRQS